VPFLVALVLGTIPLYSSLIIQQSPAHVLGTPGQTEVKLSCRHGDTSYPYLYWYQQKTASSSMELIGFLQYENVFPEEKFKARFKLSGHAKADAFLVISNITVQDSAVYFCAASITYPAYFGAGTKLTVLDPNKITKPEELKVKLLNHSSEEECTEKRVTLVCLAEDFYPDHIDLAWYIDDKEESTGVAKDDSAKLNTDSNTYSISSRLSIPFKKWNQGNTYKCKVTFHYPKEKSNDGKWTTESSTRWESLTAPKRKSLHFFTFHRW
uniref:Ig-like domain-containing protein n=1 Tax=Astyanax mexicanus TaxID=7994 RepID=A0A8B9RIV8_ASTMX